ncbi:hypothetical protein ACRXCV_01120 [Halobacteriovorax sp. GFR7]|uniref:hypothetical protein n=1 Tax=Bacteriovoracales TaxID=2024979 RepID=UPI0011AF4728|nr:MULTISPECIES: hypothetical protein [Bacteriovoracales]
MIWMDINDYSLLKGISISTIRRYIKRDKLIWKFDQGKYLIQMNEWEYNDSLSASNAIVYLKRLQEEHELLKKELIKTKQENNEYKMLVDLYEGRLNENNQITYN